MPRESFRPVVPEDLLRNGRLAAAQHKQAMSTLVRSVISIAAGRIEPHTTTENFIRRRWGNSDTGGISMMVKAASAPALTSSAGWAKELSHTTLAFLSSLVPLSAGADLLSRGLQLTFDGANTINISTATVPLGDFVAEGQPIPVVSGTSTSQTILEAHKFASITVLTREVVEGGNAEALVRDALLQSTGPSLDRRLFDANAGVPDLRPPGLLFGKTPLSPASAADKGIDMIADLSTLAAAVAPYAGNGGIIFIAAAAQSTAITIGLFRFDFPLLTSTSLPAGTVIAVARPALVTALGATPQIDESKAATLHTDTAPQAIASGGTMPSPVTVTFQTDKIALRLRWPISWALRDPNAIAFMSAVTWP
jgi:hypothetical protein